MPTTPILHTDRAGPSSPHHLPPPRQMTRSTRLPPPAPSSRSYHADDDDDPFSIRGGNGSVAQREHGESSSSANDRARRLLQGQRAPRPEIELPGLSSDEDDEPMARMRSMMRPTGNQHDGPAMPAMDRGGPDPSSFFYGRPDNSREAEMAMEVDESTLDPVEAARMQAMEGATDEEPAVDEGDTADTEEAEVEGDTADEGAMEVDSNFDPTGLKEIGSLASWTVSTCKPGSGVEALRSDDTNLFWQSDGPQPHHLNIHFSRLVSILSIRIYLDFEADESYTPTRLLFLAGTGYHDLLAFAQLQFLEPKGWIDVDLSNVGGGPQGNELRCFLVQLRVMENHQNGKDTHVRGLKIYAKDERQGHKEGLRLKDRLSIGGEGNPELEERIKKEGNGGHLLEEPDWMGEPELR